MSPTQCLCRQLQMKLNAVMVMVMRGMRMSNKRKESYVVSFESCVDFERYVDLETRVDWGFESHGDLERYVDLESHVDFESCVDWGFESHVDLESHVDWVQLV